MAKQGIHPDYHEINIVMTDGTKYKTRSTWGKPGDTMTLDVDSKTHPAWVGGVNLRKTGQMEKFTNKFSHFATIGGKGAKAEGNAATGGEAKVEKKADAKIDAKKKDKK